MFNIRKKPPTVQIGDKKIEVKPLTLENSLRLILLLGPYVAKVQKRWPRILATLEGRSQPGLLEILLKELRQELAMLPVEVRDAFALCLDVEPEFVATNATAEDLLKALPVLDKCNNFKALYDSCYRLGVVT